MNQSPRFRQERDRDFSPLKNLNERKGDATSNTSIDQPNRVDRPQRSFSDRHQSPQKNPNSSQRAEYQGVKESPRRNTIPVRSRPKRADFEEREDLICGPNAVESLLENEPARIHRIVLQHGAGSVKLYKLQEKAEKLKIHTQQLPVGKLDELHPNHQGVVAFCHEKALIHWDDLLEEIVNLDEVALVIASGVEDPRNLGACIRSALGLGAKALLLPNKGGCGLTATAAKAAAGALEILPICRPPVLESAVQQLRDMGFEVYSLEGDGDIYAHQAQLASKSVFITGGEDQGVPPYLRKKSTKILRLPIDSKAHSFNTSVALALGLYEWQKQKQFKSLISSTN